MKILYVYESIARWGGIERVWTDKINWLADNGHDVKLITTIQSNHHIPYRIDNRVNIKDIGIQFHYSYHYKGLRKLWDKWCRYIKFENILSKEIDDFKPDVIICVATSYVPTLIKLKKDIPLVAESHNLCTYLYYEPRTSLVNRYRNYRLLYAISQADSIVTLTEGDAEEWRKYNKNIFVIPNIVHLNPTDKISNCAKKNIIFVGRISDQKGIPALINIWKIVTYRYPEWVLDIYGDCESSELLDLLNNAINDSPNIVLHSPTNNIFEKYCESSIFILTSVYEPFGLVIPEAMSCGLPVVSFDCPYGPRDIITNGEDGYLVQPGDYKTFADKVCYLIEHPEERKRMGKNAILSAQRYNPENIMPKWIQLYESLIK